MVGGNDNEVGAHAKTRPNLKALNSSFFTLTTRKCGKDVDRAIISSNPTGFSSRNRKSTSGKTFVRFFYSIIGNPFNVFGNDNEDLNLNHVICRSEITDTLG